MRCRVLPGLFVLALAVVTCGTPDRQYGAADGGEGSDDSSSSGAGQEHSSGAGGTPSRGGSADAGGTPGAGGSASGASTAGAAGVGEEDCSHCPEKAGATTSCDGSGCSYTCSPGFMVCADDSCGRTLWDFDSGDLQGFQSVTTGEVIEASVGKTFAGSHALAGRLVEGSAYEIELEAPLCGGAATNVMGKRLVAQVLMDMVASAGQSGAPNPTLCWSWRDASGLYHADTGCKGPTKTGWYRFVAYTPVAAPDVTAIRLKVTLGSGWRGKMYLDSLSLSD